MRPTMHQPSPASPRIRLGVCLLACCCTLAAHANTVPPAPAPKLTVPPALVQIPLRPANSSNIVVGARPTGNNPPVSSNTQGGAGRTTTCPPTLACPPGTGSTAPTTNTSSNSAPPSGSTNGPANGNCPPTRGCPPSNTVNNPRPPTQPVATPRAPTVEGVRLVNTLPVTPTLTPQLPVQPTPPVAPTPALPNLAASPPSGAPTKTDTPAIVALSAPPPAQRWLNPAPETPILGGETEAINGQVVVFWPDASTAFAAKSGLFQQYNVRPIQEKYLPHLGGAYALYQFPSTAEAKRWRDKIRQQHSDWVVDLNWRYRGLGQARFYGAQLLGAGTQSLDTQGVRVGMLDGPVQKITALQKLKLTQASFLTSSDLASSSGHGTAVASLMAGEDRSNGFQGLGSGMSLYAGVVMRREGNQDSTRTDLLAQGLDWLLGQKVQVINLSLGGPEDAVLSRLFRLVLQKKVLLVAAAGNSGPHAPPVYPAAYPGVLAVTAVDALSQGYEQANQGSYISLSAPGVDVWAPGENGGRYLSGTSFAAPWVTATIAALLKQNPNLNREQVRMVLCHTAEDLGEPGPDAQFGCGLVQARKAMAMAKTVD